MTCNQAHAPFEVVAEDAFELSNRRYLRLVRALESAAVMGADQIIVHALTPAQGDDMVRFNEQFYNSLEPYCEKFGIRVAVENLFMDPRNPETGTYCDKKFGTPAGMMDLMERLNPEYFVICIDLGHAKLTGNHPEDFVRGVDAGRLKALHVQDNDFGYDCHVLPYGGRLNWDNITQSLAEVGYTGDITLEVFGFLSRIEDGMMLNALKFAAATARYLLEKVEAFTAK